MGAKTIDIDFDLIATQFFQMVSSELDPFTKQQGEIKKEGEGKISLFTPSHIQFAKYGRGPGKKPPLDPILEWIKREGIVFDGTDQKGTAFAIQASIGKKGTKNWVKNAPNAMEEAITNNREEYDKKLGDIYRIELSDHLNGIFEKLIPKEIKL